MTWQGTENTNADFPGATSILQGIARAVEAGGRQSELERRRQLHAQRGRTSPSWCSAKTPTPSGSATCKSIDYHGAGGAELALLQQLRQASVPIVCVFLTGRPLWIKPELTACDAFVVAWLPGSEGGGVADVLFRNANGKVNYDFVGKLSFSWPRTRIADRAQPQRCGLRSAVPVRLRPALLMRY